MERTQSKNLIPGANRPVLHALTGNYRVVEADTPVVVLVTEKDVEHAIPHDPRNCAIAESCRRLGAREAVVGASVAYIVRQTPEGEWVAVKYTVPKGTRRAIDRFDVSGVMPAKGFRLSPVKPSETPEGIARKRRNPTPAYERATQTKRKPAKIELRHANDVIVLRKS